MARRLDFELVALNVTNAPLSLSGEKRDAAIAAFTEGAQHSGAVLQEKAAANNIVFTHRVEIAYQDEMMEILHGQDSGLRYVLTEPDPEVAKKQADRVTIPVFDLGCYQSLATKYDFRSIPHIQNTEHPARISGQGVLLGRLIIDA